MRAVTWTQVAQYIILIVAYMIPVVWLSVKQTGIPIPQIVYGQQLEKVTALEEKFINDPKEIEVRGIFKARADAAAAKLKDADKAYADDKAAAVAAVEKAKAENDRRSADPPEKTLGEIPVDVAAGQGRLGEGGGTRRARGASDSPRRGVPRQGRAPRATRRAATSLRSSSA